MEWLGEEISNHILSWTMFKTDFFRFNLVSDEVVANVDVTSTSTAGGATVIL
jgi:hypothetical protein